MISEREANGLRRSPFIELTENEILFVKEEINALGADMSVFRFNQGRSTSYVDDDDVIFIKGNIFPNVSSAHPRDLMSVRAVLAHEYYGHRQFRNTAAKRSSWNDEFRASYSAAKTAPNLTKEDRRLLILDALQRAKDAGVKIIYNSFIRRVLYGDDYA